MTTQTKGTTMAVKTKTKVELVDLINASSDPMQFTVFFTRSERKAIREAACEGLVPLYKDHGVLYVGQRS